MSLFKKEQYVGKVCGFDYLIDYPDWKARFDDLLNSINI